MTRTSAGLLGLTLFFTSMSCLGAQQTQSASPTNPQTVQPATPDVSQSAIAQEKTDQPAEGKQEATSLKPPQSAGVALSNVKGKKGEQVYTGPTTVIELAPTPMLDEEGKQRQAPDGKLMFNPPVKQQRDKKGHPLF
ncbi:MAG: hypothetical protein ACRD3K_13830, partial [Edaphobacter sp.]